MKQGLGLSSTMSVEPVHALDEARAKARLDKEEAAKVDMSDSDEVCTDSELLKATEGMKQGLGMSSTVSVEPVHAAGDRALVVAMQHKSWLEERTAAESRGEVLTIFLNPELERIFGPGATRLAFEHQVSGQSTQSVVEAEEGSVSQDEDDEALSWSSQVNLAESVDISDQTDRLESLVSSTPKIQIKRGRKRVKSEGRVSTGSKSPPVRRLMSESDLDPGDVVDLMALGSSFITSDSEASDSRGNENKKIRLEDEVHSTGGLEGGLDSSSGSVGANQSGVGREDSVIEFSMDMDARKGDDSESENELSSGDTGDALSPGSPGKGVDDGGL